MSGQFDNFLHRESRLGERDSEGAFTLDLSRSVEKFTQSALPSSYHFLLKFVQVANRVGAPQLDIRTSRQQTRLKFQTRLDALSSLEPESVAGYLQAPLAPRDPVIRDLVAGLLGALHPRNSRVSWSLTEGEVSRNLLIDESRRVHLLDSERLLEDEGSEPSLTLELRLAHRVGWRFWENSRRRAETVSILQHHCQLSATRLVIDGREVVCPSCSFFNEHLSEPGQARFNAATGTFVNTASRVAASNIVFELAAPEEVAVSVLRPSLTTYCVKEDHLNLWTQGTRFGNSLRPDGDCSCSWMLQFVRDGQNLSMRKTKKRDRYRSILVMNLQGPGSTQPLRLMVVRHGVLLFDSSTTVSEEGLDGFRGCTLLVADDEMTTDLSGLQLVRDEGFVRAIQSRQQLLGLGEEFFVRAAELLHFC